MKYNEARKPKDRDFLRTVEGMFFCVTGYLHPPDRCTAYLKYSPTSQGKWQDEATAYRRELPYYHVRNVEKTVDYLEENYPAYVYDCPVRDFRFSMVPRERVARYYAPEKRMRDLVADPRDTLEVQVQGMVQEVARATSIEPDALGITGSILIGLHNPDFSDIDLTIYGLRNAQRLRAALFARALWAPPSSINGPRVLQTDFPSARGRLDSSPGGAGTTEPIRVGTSPFTLFAPTMRSLKPMGTTHTVGKDMRISRPPS